MGVTAQKKIRRDNLIQSWFDANEQKDVSRADLIRRINKKTGHNYNNSKFWQYLTGRLRAPVPIMKEINNDLEMILTFLIKEKQLEPAELAVSLTIPLHK